MPDPFDSSHTGASNYIFDKPPDKSRCYVQAFGFAVPYGFKFVQTSFAEGRMHSALIANGSDLRSAATTSKSIKANVKGGCAFVSASLAFNYNSELGNTEEDMYNNEVMHSQHTFFSTLYTLVLDKPNVRFSGKGSFKGFWPDIHEYAKGKTSGAEIFANYGTHYAHAISFGARGKAQHSYTKETMSTMLQNCKKLGWGAEAKVSGKIGGFKGGVGGGYSQEDKADDMKKIDATTDFQEGTYECVGSSSCNSSGEAHAVDQTAVPVLVDLRPITELVAPPLFDTYEMTVNVRRRLIADLMIYLAGKEPSTVDVFHFLSLSFSRPRVFYQSDPAHLEEFPGWGVFTCSSPISVKVTGSSNGGKETPLQFQNFSFAQEAPPPIKQAFCYSGPKTDHQVCVEFTLPNTWSYKPMTGDDDWDARVSPEDYPPREMKLEFALDDERLLSAEGVSGTFMLPATKVTWEGQTVPDKPPVIIRFPVVLRKLNLQDAFFNGLPAEWKEAEWKT